MEFKNLVKIHLLLNLIIFVGYILAEGELFKINKLNLVWTKAQHSLGPTKLKDLKKDLTKHEFDELTLKKMKAHNQDKDGLYEATVRKKLLTIMSKYSLERYYDDIHPSIENEPSHKQINLDKMKVEKSSDSKEMKPTFRDKKLDKLWKKAEQLSFTQEQLMVLHEEFQHQQDKLNEHYDYMNAIDQELESKSKDAENQENSIESNLNAKSSKKGKPQENPPEKKARLDSNIQQSLKAKYRDIKKNIDKLQQKIASGQIDDDVGPFEEEPVNELWHSAIAANFTANELESLKEELEHYQVRIKKFKHFEVQLERNKLGSKEQRFDTEPADDETKHIKRRVDELAYKIDKTHNSIKNKIASRRDEL